jgi:hypothetical protein
VADRNTLIANVRSILQEPVNGFWQDTEFIKWAQEASDDLAEGAMIEIGPVTIPTIVNQELYDLPVDFGKAVRVEREIAPGSATFATMLPWSINHRREAVGLPGGYYIWMTNKLGIIPVPDTVVDLRVYYYSKGNTLALGTDIPIIDPQYHRLIEEYMLAMAKIKDENPSYQIHVSNYSAGRSDMIQNILEARRGAQSFSIVRDVG